MHQLIVTLKLSKIVPWLNSVIFYINFLISNWLYESIDDLDVALFLSSADSVPEIRT
jgi:hypothetical protein